MNGRFKLHIANSITGVRILCGLALLSFPAFSKWFYVFYVAGGLSDALDGWTARRLGAVSDFGARLDTVADIVFFGAVLIKVFCNFTFPFWIVLWVIGIAALRIIGIAVGLVSSHRLASVHSIMNRVSGLLLFAIPLCIGLFPWKALAVLVIITCVAATAASIQELFIILKGESEQPAK